MRGVLRGGKQPPAVGPHSDGGVHPGITSSPPPSSLHHGGFRVDQRHVGRQKAQLGDLGMQGDPFRSFVNSGTYGAAIASRPV